MAPASQAAVSRDESSECCRGWIGTARVKATAAAKVTTKEPFMVGLEV